MMTLQFMKKSTVRGTVSLGRGGYDYVFSDDVSETVFAGPRPENNSTVWSSADVLKSREHTGFWGIGLVS